MDEAYYARLAVESPSRQSSDPETFRSALCAYLGSGIATLRMLASGWETTLYEFALRERSEMLPGVEPGMPLVLRFYANAAAADKGAREYRTMRHLLGAGYPVPRPYLFESGAESVGAPFLIMERLGGGPLFAIRSFPQAFRTFSMGFMGFVRTHAQLHRIAPTPEAIAMLAQPPEAGNSATGLGAADGPQAGKLLDHALDTIAARVDSGPLPELAATLAQLRDRAAEFSSATPSFVHMDYHPQNVLVRGFKVTGVIDWANAAVGDRHFDAAMTAVILSTSTMEHPRWMRRNAAGNSLRITFNALYFALYHAMAPMDLKRLHYYQGVAGALRLSMLGMMRRRGPESVGFRPGAISEVTPSVLDLLSRYVARKTGTPVATI